eukprot:TRINITY_DN8169_c0_g1_i1.p1 TRINITY_DN8169_c0_g1~~TRINITY_DN8169_c0_g1_i1.p1  ORF type:complete len:425 (+),score=80.53 TRINITY_DN8169_c0_g1_i1:548-1822(+)
MSSTQDPVVIDCLYGTYHLNFSTNLTAEIDHFSFLNGNNDFSMGGCIFMGVDPDWFISVTIRNCYFSRCQADQGGAIGVYYAQIAIHNTTFENNLADDFGGAIFFDGDNAGSLISHCTFTNNASPNGGAISAVGGGLTIRDSLFQYNSGFSGGALYLLNADVGEIIIAGVDIQNNTASYGAGIFITFPGNISIGYSKIFHNQGNAGTGIYIDGGQIEGYSVLTFQNLTIFENTGKYGGGINFNTTHPSNVQGKFNGIQIWNNIQVFENEGDGLWFEDSASVPATFGIGGMVLTNNEPENFHCISDKLNFCADDPCLVKTCSLCAGTCAIEDGENLCHHYLDNPCAAHEYCEFVPPPNNSPGQVQVCKCKEGWEGVVCDTPVKKPPRCANGINFYSIVYSFSIFESELLTPCDSTKKKASRRSRL